jgi:hypothetical protein
MLEQPMIEKLHSMRLQGMADALKAQEQDPGVRELSFAERLSLLAEPSQLRASEAGMPFVFNEGIPKVSTTF